METNHRQRLIHIIFAISGIAYFPFSEWISTTQFGTTLFLWGQLLYGLALLAAVLGLPVLIVATFFKRTRPHAKHYILVSLLLIPSCMGGMILGKRLRMDGMASCAQRAQPLILAIEQYERDHAAPPDSLDALVPDYLPRVPSTGMMAYPEFDYHTGRESKERYAENPWAVSIFTPSGGINFDMMLYLPKQNYPDRGYGGWLERIGDWAYVHE